jgi:hypothetical protein
MVTALMLEDARMDWHLKWLPLTAMKAFMPMSVQTSRMVYTTR